MPALVLASGCSGNVEPRLCPPAQGAATSELGSQQREYLVATVVAGPQFGP